MIIKNLGKVVGDSAYETWLKQGNTGTEQDFLNSLKADVNAELYTDKTIITGGIPLQWSHGAYSVATGEWADAFSTLFMCSEWIETTTLPTITRPELLDGTGNFISLKNGDTYVGFWSGGNYYKAGAMVDANIVESLVFTQASLCIRTAPVNDQMGTDYTQIELVGEGTKEEVVKCSRINNLEENVETLEGRKYYIFGDSITYWDNRLATWLDSSLQPYYMIGFPTLIQNILGVKVSNYGQNGDQSSQVTARLKQTDLTGVDAVLYMAGANDAANNVSFDTFRANIQEAIDYVKTNYPTTKFYLLAPIWCRQDGFITSYADVMQQVAFGSNVPILRWDITAQINANSSSQFLFDGVHPNNEGHRLLADILVGFLKNN